MRPIFSLFFRVMDCFLAEGMEVIFRLALALLLLAKHELLILDMEGVIRVRIENCPYVMCILRNVMGFQSPDIPRL